VKHAARDSIGSTLQTARRVTDPAVALRVRDAGLDAFHDAMHVTYAAAVVVVFFAFLVAWKWLPARAHDWEGEHVTGLALEHQIAAVVETVLGGLSVVDQ
jgi:hypothetical protein